MAKHILKRLIGIVPVLLGVTLVVFLILVVLPGDPARLMAGEFADPETVESIRREMGLDRPVIVQYLDMLWRFLHGDFGTSYISRLPVIWEIQQTFPKTVVLSISAALCSFILGSVLGLCAARYQGTIIDRIITTFSVMGLSMPMFWTALLLQMLFSVRLGLLPPSGYGIGFDKYLILPLLTLVLPSIGMNSRVARQAFLDALSEDYVRTAHAKGLPPRLVYFKHVMKNGLIPVVAVSISDFSRLLTGMMMVEAIFSWPGIGKYGYDALINKDFPALEGTVVVLTAAVAIVNTLADLLYAAIDPRVRYD